MKTPEKPQQQPEEEEEDSEYPSMLDPFLRGPSIIDPALLGPSMLDPSLPHPSMLSPSHDGSNVSTEIPQKMSTALNHGVTLPNSEPEKEANESEQQSVQLRSKKARTCSLDNKISATNDEVNSTESPTDLQTRFSQSEDLGPYGKHVSPSTIIMIPTPGFTKNEPNQKLLADIRDINNELKKTVLEVASVSESTKETIVRCTYKPTELYDEVEKEFGVTIPLEACSIEFLVPSDYPRSLPRILKDSDKQPVGYCNDIEEAMNQVRSQFICSNDQKPLKEMVQTWCFYVPSSFRHFIGLRKCAFLV